MSGQKVQVLAPKPRVIKVAFAASGMAAAPRGGGERPALSLPESPDLNRVLRKVTEYFAQNPPKWDEGAKMMQELLEGRIFDGEIADQQMLDPFYSVYSADQRLYIPFARYCQQLLCQLPVEGLEAYRFLTDGRARAAFEEAQESLDSERLQRLSELFFASSSGPQIVALLADISELSGQVTRAIFLRQRLMESYPDLSPDFEIGLLLRQAHAAALLADQDRYDAAMKALLARGPERLVEVAGKRLSVGDLAKHPAFVLRRRATPRIRRAVPSVGLEPAVKEPAGSAKAQPSLARLWRFAFADPDPYGLRTKKKTANRNGMIFFGGNAMPRQLPSPKYDRPGSRLLSWSEGERVHVAFKDDDRLQVLGALSGKVEARDAAAKRRVRRSNNRPLRVRIPVTDFALQSVTTDGDRLYCTTNNKTPSQGRNQSRYPYRNELLCFDLANGQVLWRTGISSDLFFQGPALRYRDWLFAPVRKQHNFCIARLHAESGKVDKVVTVHGGGTALLRVPAVLPVVVGNQLVHLTNAGAIASFSLPNLELRWLRAYETLSPEEPEPRVVKTTRRNRGYQVQEVRLKRWKPHAPIVHNGTVIIAPIDSDALICLDVNSGKPSWFLPRREAQHSAKFRELIGGDGERLFLLGKTTLQAIDLSSGKRLYEQSLEALPQGPVSGWGTVAGAHIWLPHKGGAYRFRKSDGAYAGSLVFPREQLGSADWTSLPQRLQFAGPILLSLCESGVTAFASTEGLGYSNVSRWQKARILAALGRLQSAFDLLAELIRLPGLSKSKQQRSASFLVRLAGEIAQDLAKTDRAAALTLLARCEKLLTASALSVDSRLLLFRVEILDPHRDAKEIRNLRERIENLTLQELGAANLPAAEAGPRAFDKSRNAPLPVEKR